jgi:hypothetical protein
LNVSAFACSFDANFGVGLAAGRSTSSGASTLVGTFPQIRGPFGDPPCQTLRILPPSRSAPGVADPEIFAQSKKLATIAIFTALAVSFLPPLAYEPDELQGEPSKPLRRSDTIAAGIPY